MYDPAIHSSNLHIFQPCTTQLYISPTCIYFSHVRPSYTYLQPAYISAMFDPAIHSSNLHIFQLCTTRLSRGRGGGDGRGGGERGGAAGASGGAARAAAAGDDDAVTVRDTHHNALFIRIHGLRRIVVRLVYIQANFFNESRCYNEKDQHDKDHVQHWRQVDLFSFFFASSSKSTWSSLSFSGCLAARLLLWEKSSLRL